MVARHGLDLDEGRSSTISGRAARARKNSVRTGPPCPRRLPARTRAAPRRPRLDATQCPAPSRFRRRPDPAQLPCRRRRSIKGDARTSSRARSTSSRVGLPIQRTRPPAATASGRLTLARAISVDAPRRPSHWPWNQMGRPRRRSAAGQCGRPTCVCGRRSPTHRRGCARRWLALPLDSSPCSAPGRRGHRRSNPRAGSSMMASNVTSSLVVFSSRRVISKASFSCNAGPGRGPGPLSCTGLTLDRKRAATSSRRACGCSNPPFQPGLGSPSRGLVPAPGAGPGTAKLWRYRCSGGTKKRGPPRPGCPERYDRAPGQLHCLTWSSASPWTRGAYRSTVRQVLHAVAWRPL